MHAALKKSIATCQAELGWLDRARGQDLSAATAELATDPKLLLPCEAAWAWLLADCEAIEMRRLAGRRWSCMRSTKSHRTLPRNLMLLSFWGEH